MIDRIFLDLDEMLLHTEVNREPHHDHHVFTLPVTPGKTYYTKFRPDANALVGFCWGLVGYDNVYILTSSFLEYAQHINKLGNLGLQPDHIFTDEDIERHTWKGAYGAKMHSACEPIRSFKNVMIDNLPPRENEKKMCFIGINKVERYIKTPDYFGWDFADCDWLNNITEKLKDIYETDP